MSRPSPLPLRIRAFSTLVQAPPFFAFTALCGSLSLLASYFEKNGRMQHRIARVWARGCVLISGSSLQIVGEENLRKLPVAVYACNHTSYMDTPIIFSALPFQFRILAKQGLWKLPFIGWHLRRSGQIPVDTGNPRASISSLSAGVRALKAGMPLFVFPEGARTPDGHPRSYMGGAAYVAVRAQVPIVPMALIGAYDLLPIHTHHFYPSRLIVAVGEPIPTKGSTTRQIDEMTARLRAEISRLYYAHSDFTPRELQSAAIEDAEAADAETPDAEAEEKVL
jgi:1-acyl-sn-glycerol-3-phosphate acyltransferase